MMQRWLKTRIFSDSKLAGWCKRWAGLLILPLIVLLIPSLPIFLTPAAQTSVELDPAPVLAERQDQAGAPVLPRVVDVSLRRGDTLGSILSRFGLDAKSAHEMIEAVRPFFNPRKMRAGENFQLFLHPQDNTVQGLEYVLRSEAIRVISGSEGWSAERREIPFVRETRLVRGIVNGNLYQDGTRAGLTPLQILQLAEIFEYDIDFFSDFQKGDSFSVAFEELRYTDGRRETGTLLAAELEADRQPFQAIYYVGEKGQGLYYDSEGRSLRRAFLRAPLSYRRISSRYSLNRRHPIFRTLRPHKAIDYAAPAGTPVVSIGRGKVTFAGWRNGYGQLVEVRHPNGYVTRYAHFSRIAGGIRPGKQVAQGDVVGYVGQTGHATGPHLHFELLRGGQKINFLALRIPPGSRLKGSELPHFATVRNERLAFLKDGIGDTARADP